MNYKYGILSSSQLCKQKEYFKGAIYQLFCFKEEGVATTRQRFTSLLQELSGFYNLLNQQEIFTAICLLEYAIDEQEHSLYRKAMLDAIGFIDMVREVEDGID